MAAYATTVASLMTKAVKIDNVTGIGVFAGTCNVTNYHSTLVAITDITGKFKDMISVVTDGCSDGGNVFHWSDSDSSFKVFFADYDAAADGALIEASDDSDVGLVNFVAYGLI